MLDDITLAKACINDSWKESKSLFLRYPGMNRYISRNIWPVDRRPTNLRCTKAGDVTRGVEVGMKLKPTGTALKHGAASILSLRMSALRASLARKARIDVEHGFTDGFGFVVDEVPKLAERPVTERLIKSQSEALIPRDVQLFQRNRVERLGYYPLSNLVVSVGHETSLPARHAFQFTSGGSSAFGLKLATDMLVATFYRSNMRRGIKQIVRENSVIEDASIDAENRFRRLNGRSVYFHDHAEDESDTIKGKSSSDGLPVDVLSITFRYDNIEMNTTLDTRQGNRTLGEIAGECALIITDGRPSAFNRQPSLGTLEHFGCNISCGGDKISGNVGIFFSYGIITKVMEFEFINHPLLRPHNDNIVCSIVYCLNSTNESSCKRNANCDSALHVNALATKVFKFYLYLGSHEEG